MGTGAHGDPGAGRDSFFGSDAAVVLKAGAKVQDSGSGNFDSSWGIHIVVGDPEVRLRGMFIRFQARALVSFKSS